MKFLVLFLVPIAFITASYTFGWISFIILLVLSVGTYVVYLIYNPGDHWVISSFIVFLASMLFTLWHLSKVKLKDKSLKIVLTKYNQQIKNLQENNASLKNEISLQNKDLERTMQFYSLIKGMADTADWRKMISMIEKSIKKFLDIPDYAVYLLDTENMMRLVAKQGKWDSVLSSIPETTMPALLPAKNLIKTEDLPNIHSNVLSLPFFQKDKLFGAIFVKTMDKQINNADVINQIWGLLSLGIMRARIYWNMEMESLTDGLTKLLRRNYFEERLKDTIKRSSFFNNPFGLMLIDLDHFKQINDTYGHQAGDEILKKVSQMLQAGIYETDLLGRWGGEEFVCLFPRTDPQGLFIKADKIRKEIENETFYAGLEQIKVTISIGITHFPRDARSFMDLVNAADQALYHAKQTGRNKVIDFRQI